jgi:hypothetical protein
MSTSTASIEGMPSPETYPVPYDAEPNYPAEVGLMHKVAEMLCPLFTSAKIGVAFAHQVARNALDDYHPVTGADYVNAARTLAFSLAALALLGETAEPEMLRPEKMRVLGRANALNRSAEQSERGMIQRRRDQSASPTAESRPPAPAQATPAQATPAQATPAQAAKPPDPDPVPDDTPDHAQIDVTPAETTAPTTTPKIPPDIPDPTRPDIYLGPPPKVITAIHYGGPNRINMAPR